MAGLPERAGTQDVLKVLTAAKTIYDRYGAATLEERKDLLAITFRSITIEPGKLTFRIDPAALVAHLLGQPVLCSDPAKLDLYTTERPFRLRRRGVEARIVLTGDHPERRMPEPALVDLITRAHIYLRSLTSGSGKTISEVATDQKVPASEVSRILPLAFLDPSITEAILDGSQPTDLTVDALARLSNLPHAWEDQRHLLGM